MRRDYEPLTVEQQQHMERQLEELQKELVDERARIDCATRDGWLSEDLECAGEDGPACWKHLLAEAQGVIDVKCTIAGCWGTKYEEAQEKLQEIRWRTYDLHRQSGHPDATCLGCQLHDIIIDESS